MSFMGDHYFEYGVFSWRIILLLLNLWKGAVGKVWVKHFFSNTC